MSLLKFENEGQMGWDVHVEQQIELALCKIYKVIPESGKTVYSISSLESENVGVRRFWSEKIKSEKEINK